jgi:hypothetical protein
MRSREQQGDSTKPSRETAAPSTPRSPTTVNGKALNVSRAVGIAAVAGRTSSAKSVVRTPPVRAQRASRPEGHRGACAVPRRRRHTGHHSGFWGGGRLRLRNGARRLTNVVRYQWRWRGGRITGRQSIRRLAFPFCGRSGVWNIKIASRWSGDDKRIDATAAFRHRVTNRRRASVSRRV